MTDRTFSDRLKDYREVAAVAGVLIACGMTWQAMRSDVALAAEQYKGVQKQFDKLEDRFRTYERRQEEMQRTQTDIRLLLEGIKARVDRDAGRPVGRE